MTAMSPYDASTSDGTLVAAIRAGDEAAFAVLVRRYQPALLRAAMSRLGQRQVAEEAVQETFLCAHRWLASYDSQYSFRTWLWTILLNQCTRLGKREARQKAAPSGRGTDESLRELDAYAARPAGEPSPLQRILNREDGERLQALLARLPVAQADALRLRFFGSLTFPEIAAAMQCSESGAKNRVKLGLLQLSQWLPNPEGPSAVSQSLAPRECDHA
jgi:RNA polymerase sigma-70 factor (ECF subfamily)